MDIVFKMRKTDLSDRAGRDSDVVGENRGLGRAAAAGGNDSCIYKQSISDIPGN